MLFQKLGADELEQIVRLMLGASAARLAAREVEFEVTDAAVALLAERGYEPEYGARPLRRVIQREIDDRIADLFVSGALGDGEGVRVDASVAEMQALQSKLNAFSRIRRVCLDAMSSSE